MKFLKKIDAIHYYNKIDNKSYSLFQEDIDRTGSKCFYVEDIKKIYNKIIRSATPHFYEFWTENTKMVFGMDIDFDKTKSTDTPLQILTQIINIVIKSALEYYSYEYLIENIIILENDSNQLIDNPNKYSAHIIFRGLNFENYLVAKDFFQRMNSKYDLVSLHVDKRIYSMTCLRLFMNMKMSKTSILIPIQYTINDKKTMGCGRSMSNDSMYQFFLSTMITYTNDSDQTINIQQITHKTISNQIKYANSANNILNVNL